VGGNVSITCEVKGLKELAEALNLMPKKLAGKALGASVKAGAKIVERQAEANVNRLTGATQKAIVAYRKPGSSQSNIAYQVGVTMKKKFTRSKVNRLSRWKRFFRGDMRETLTQQVPAYWWRFQEFGTSKMAAHPFLRPAWTQTSGQALAMIKLMLEKAVVIAAAQVPKYRG
jgi:HK97 gp10 family phage protein